MRVYLIKNKSDKYQQTTLQVNPSDELSNEGFEESVEIRNNELNLQHTPEARDYPEPNNHTSDCFELDGNGLYAVEIDGVVIPYYFRPEQLPKFFNRANPQQLMFIECVDFEEEEDSGIIIVPPPPIRVEQPR